MNRKELNAKKAFVILLLCPLKLRSTLSCNLFSSNYFILLNHFRLDMFFVCVVCVFVYLSPVPIFTTFVILKMFFIISFFFFGLFKASPDMFSSHCSHDFNSKLCLSKGRYKLKTFLPQTF